MIYLQFVAGTDIGAHLIEWFGHSVPYSHVDTVLPDGRLLGARSDEVGGAPAGVQIRDPGYVGSNLVLRIDVASSDEQAKIYYDFVRSQIGKPYDGEAILAFVAGRNWQDPEAWFCSELVAAGLEYSSIVLPLAAPTAKITPADLILILSAIVPVSL